jgi:hypothetical protein
MSRNLTEKCCVVEGTGFRGFAGVLEGVLEKWVFACGAFVVLLWCCAWQRWTQNRTSLDAEKWDSDYKFIFRYSGSLEASPGLKKTSYKECHRALERITPCRLYMLCLRF